MPFETSVLDFMGRSHQMASLTPLFTIILCQIFFTTAKSSTKIPLGSTLRADGSGSSWKSHSGDFAFGFQAVSGGYLLSIWFDKVPDKTVVWWANSDNPVPPGSKVELFGDGRLELSDPGGTLVWRADSAGHGAAFGAMLDTGNLVVVGDGGAALWQSFDEPTDTLLPGQVLNRGVSLISRFSGGNYSRGRFTFILQNDGNLVMYTRNIPQNDVVSAYWSTQTVGTGFRLIFNQSGYIFLTARDNSVIYYLSSSHAQPTAQFYHRLTLHSDGVLRHYLRPKSGAADWSVVAYFPSNICLRILQETARGACGFNSLCAIGADGSPNCACPEGYSLVNPSDRSGDCKADFVPQRCSTDPKAAADEYGFVEMVDTDWPLSDYAHFVPVSEEWCRRECLVDCFCAVGIYRESNCWKKKIPLSNGRIDATVGGKAMIKIGKKKMMNNGTRSGD